ncbi:hypothetical protein PPTG_02346 [Phytophthora nicotianae INRA-310]|uniref:Uncharacterized protein n=1 Tax=Phytophthora nicotianae (strain INRA-310) TaxID=761204 RepID=W2RAK9_PHYN3|nr:hypothetical protein PPTG_02346 [Phytophthora nicotianae INRA-310]ETN22397.1 hypothetical protein PPTG_02346 [Phytophthora nicotianae INRA-310]
MFFLVAVLTIASQSSGHNGEIAHDYDESDKDKASSNEGHEDKISSSDAAPKSNSDSHSNQTPKIRDRRRGGTRTSCAKKRQSKELSGKVVRQTAATCIKLGKRSSRLDNSHEAEKENRTSKQRKGQIDRANLFKEVKEQRAQLLESFMDMQKETQQQRLEFERQEREKDRLDRESEREERRLEREERRKEREVQAKLTASLLQHIKQNND